MKKDPSGTLYVPVRDSNEPDKQPLPDSLPEASRIKSATNFYMFNTIACICVTFVFPPFILLAVLFLYQAKKQKGGKE